MTTKAVKFITHEGPGKYDDLCQAAILSAQARTAILIILGGNKGEGFSLCTTAPEDLGKVSSLLRKVADGIDAMIKSSGTN
jgi:hypothetical protein